MDEADDFTPLLSVNMILLPYIVHPPFLPFLHSFFFHLPLFFKKSSFVLDIYHKIMRHKLSQVHSRIMNMVILSLFFFFPDRKIPHFKLNNLNMYGGRLTIIWLLFRNRLETDEFYINEGIYHIIFFFTEKQELKGIKKTPSGILHIFFSTFCISEGWRNKNALIPFSNE